MHEEVNSVPELKPHFLEDPADKRASHLFLSLIL